MHWSKLKEKAAGKYRLLFLLKIYQHCGKRVLRFHLAIIVLTVLIFSKPTRTSSRQYLNRIYKLKKPAFKKPNFISSYKQLFCFADSLADRVASWLGNINLDSIHIHTKPVFNRFVSEIKQGQGAFFICSHLGNMEILRAIGSFKEAKINAVVQIAHTSTFNNFLKKLHPKVSTNLISATDIGIDTIINLKEKLQQGELVVIAADRTAAKNPDKNLMANFLGEPVAFPKGIFVMASLMECPIYFSFCLKDDHGNYNLYFYQTEIKFSQTTRKYREENIQKLAEEYASHLETLCLAYPYQWFNFFDFWQ